MYSRDWASPVLAACLRSRHRPLPRCGRSLDSLAVSATSETIPTSATSATIAIKDLFRPDFGIAVLPSILFYFFILYAARAIVTHVVADSEVESDVDEVEENDDMVEDEETALVQMR